MPSDLEPIAEWNCMLFGCTADNTNCDTQVFVTWVGTDSQGRHCTSDDFRLTGFDAYGVQSYVDAAENLSHKTYTSNEL